jgi:hypothetical protein
VTYNDKQYDAALDFINASDANITAEWDAKRVGVYDLYEDIYRNSTVALRIVLRGDDQAPIIMPNGKKLIEATDRFLGVNLDFLVEAVGDEGARQEVELWWADFWKRESIPTKFGSNKRWGLVRGDSYFYVYAKPEKVSGRRLCLEELDPRQVFEIENDPDDPKRLMGVHIVDLVSDFREPDKPEKKVARRRTFRRQFDEFGEPAGVTSELTFWEVGKWDDRTVKAQEKQERVPNGELDQEEELLPPPISQLPLYKWRNAPPQNSSWGTSQLAGLETLLYALNQSLSDEDATLVFQGLGMYVTDASPPIDPNTGDVTDWNIGPKQIIEISTGQKFERVTGVSDVAPYIEHMKYIDESMCEASGTPQIAIGRVDVSVAESGISLQLQLMPLIAANKEKELELINVMDQLFYDITSMWLPAYEPEMFGNVETMTELSVVCVFDDPMPRNRDAEIQETVLLDASGLILKSMVVAKLRDLGWKYPATDALGNALTDDDIAAMLLDQASAVAQASDPFSAGALGMTNGIDEQGNPVSNPELNGQVPPQNTPDKTTVDLGIT